MENEFLLVDTTTFPTNISSNIKMLQFVPQLQTITENNCLRYLEFLFVCF